MNWRVLVVTLSVGLTTPAVTHAVEGGIPNATIPVIPGAEGFGIHTSAGRGGKVYKVTNLNGDGQGSLTECLMASGPRVCVFEVGGEIQLDNDLIVLNSYLTVAGQTAPPPGITIRDGGLRIATHDVLIQHIRVRLGTKNGRSVNGVALSVRGENHGSNNSANIVIDHVSLSWAWNKLFDTWSPGVSDVTVSNSILSEPLHRSINSTGPQSNAMLIGPGHQRIAIVGNLFAHANHRSPYLKGGSSSAIINNLIYNAAWQAIQLEDGEGVGMIRSSIVGNVVVLGPDSRNDLPLLQVKNDVTAGGVFLQDNMHPLASNDPWVSVVENLSGNSVKSATPVVEISDFRVSPARVVEDQVLCHAGALPFFRDVTDRRIMQETASRTGRRIDCVEGGESGCRISAGGWPDSKATFRKLVIPYRPSDDDDKDGYTNLEEWLHEFSRYVERPSADCASKGRLN